ncbi:xylanase deacetylase [Paenibacillus swuensis]|uniref:Xylanase deacetylase n=2 Tax=Paenibacillus swuensis TaxID=1178515 RepID=A0A172TQD7_9BACL|nr:xylanase deacetylase [Paenibacillus swuensis]
MTIYRWTGLAAAALLTITVGCSSNANIQAVKTEETPQQTAKPPTTTKPAPVTTVNPTPQPKPDTKPSKPVPEPVQEPKQPVMKQYYMNKNYFFKPISPDINKKAVLLTFDDGPKDKAIIESMLNTLDKHKAKAIFFVNGYRVKQHPELLKLIADRKQTIGNHSWDHIDLKKQSAAEVSKQLGDVQAIVKKITGISPKYFRPPFGSGGDAVKKEALRQGMLFMTWSNGSEDWLGKNKNKPDQVINNVMKQLAPGSNILMHELPWTAEALDILLTKMTSQGYVFINPDTIDITKK